MKKPIIYWLILTYQRPDSFFRLMKSINCQINADQFDFYFVIWDNAGDSETWKRFTASLLSLDKRIDYVRSPNNLKMLGKRALEDRLLARIAPEPTDWIVHVDDDVEFEAGWLHAAHRSALEHQWDASGSTEMWHDKLIYSGQSSLEMLEDQNGRRELWSWRFEIVDPSSAPRPVVFAGHRALLVRSTNAARVRHDLRFAIGGEDLDYSLSLAADGATLGIAPSARIRHRAHGEADAIDFRTRPDVVRSWRAFYRKWGFVRINAASEAGLSTEEWLSIIRDDGLDLCALH